MANLTQRRARWLHQYALRHAEIIVAQTTAQQRMLAQEFGLHACVVPSCTTDPIASSADEPTIQPSRGKRVLWIGRLSPYKRPDILLALAECCPDLLFDVVGISQQHDAPNAGLVGLLRSLPNVTLHGFVPHSRIRFWRLGPEESL